MEILPSAHFVEINLIHYQYSSSFPLRAVFALTFDKHSLRVKSEDYIKIAINSSVHNASPFNCWHSR